ncbi:UdgX family uracil-DNA binding protein [Mycolicibacterium thermoresistibile]
MAVTGAARFVPATRDLGELAEAVHACKGCDLYVDATQAVFGAGPGTAPMVMVGEQPGDREDTAGQPFVGPAGRLLHRALDAAGIDRAEVYVTNAVKHFTFTRGRRRIHKTPSRSDVVACRPWLIAELDSVRPEVVVLLGATAAKSLLGPDFRLTAHRGEVLRLPAGDATVGLGVDPLVVATVHPSAVLRGRPGDRAEAFDALVADLEVAAGLMGS